MMKECKKETIKYSISLPCFSTLRLQRKAEGRQRQNKSTFTNYATLGGNYRTLNAELFVNQNRVIMIM
jgi:hypothetical protein